MLATISSSLTAGLFDAIKDIFKTVTNLPNIFAMLLQSALALVYSILYYTFMSIAVSVNFFEALFMKFAGIDPMLTNEGKYQDIITIFIGSDEVWGLFVSILVLSIVLLMLFTFIAIIKSEFSLDAKGSAKGPIIARSLKSLAMLVIVPVVSVMGIYATNALTQTINGMFRNGDDVPLSNQVFYIAAYGANRARIDGNFKNYIAGNTVQGLWDKYSLPDNSKNRDGGTFSDPDTVAYEIDIAFRGERTIQGDSWVMLDIVSQSDIGFQQDILFTTQPWIYLSNTFTPWNAAVVSYYYSLANFDYTIGVTATVYLTILLLFMVFSLIKRVFEITILLLLAPPMVAMAPLDNGAATKKWATEFSKRVLAIIGPVFSINMYFVLTPIFSSLTIFSGTIYSSAFYGTLDPMTLGMSTSMLNVLSPAAYNPAFSLICMLAGMSVVKQASALLCNLLGVGDLTKESLDMAKKTAQTAVKVAAAAMTGGAAAAAMATAQAAAGDADKGYAEAHSEADAARGKLKEAETSGDPNRIAEAKKEKELAETKEKEAKATQTEAQANLKGAKKDHKEAQSKFYQTAFSGVADTVGLNIGADSLIDPAIKMKDAAKDRDEYEEAKSKGQLKLKGEGTKAREEIERKKAYESGVAIREERKQNNEIANNDALAGLGDGEDGRPLVSMGMATAAQREATAAQRKVESDFNRRMAAIRRSAAGAGINDDQREFLAKHGIAESDINNTAVVDAARTRAVDSDAGVQFYRKNATTASGLATTVTRLDSASLEELRKALVNNHRNSDGSITLSNGTTLKSDELNMLSTLGQAETARKQAAATRQGNVDKKIQDTLEQEAADQIIEARRTGSASSAVDEGMKPFDRNSLADAVQQGIEESISRLKSAIAEALRSSKLDVKGLTEVKAQIMKNAEAAMREKAQGKGDDEVAKILQDGLDKLTKALEGKK